MYQYSQGHDLASSQTKVKIGVLARGSMDKELKVDPWEANASL